MDERLPFGRIRQLRNHSGKKTEHAAALNKIESGHRRDPDGNANDCRPNEISLAGCVYKKDNAEQRERGLGENSQREIDQHRRSGGGNRCSANRSEPRPNNVAADRSRRHQRADRLTDPTHPINFSKAGTLSPRK